MVKQDPFIRQLVGPVERELAQKWKLNLKLKTIRDIANERHEVAHDPIKTDIPRLIKTDSFAVCSSTVNDVKACRQGLRPQTDQKDKTELTTKSSRKDDLSVN
ncbi:unnamed protein product [Rotaria socialis]|uniref:Uncharacterized protein n=2 Tax=Rotaria socialis TaxID=392032 RepID=A0A820WVE2_9BILA|nr:unnamed protein product [Rotaria socialis]